jgi:hypothetical protein
LVGDNTNFEALFCCFLILIWISFDYIASLLFNGAAKREFFRKRKRAKQKKKANIK